MNMKMHPALKIIMADSNLKNHVKVKKFWNVIKEASIAFGQHKVFKLSASLCFYAIFSIGPMMLVIIFISGIFFSRPAIEGTINTQIGGLIGNDAATQIQELIKNTSVSSNNFMAVIGFVLLFFAATTVFTEMQDSMNVIWELKVKTNRNWQQSWRNRLLSFFIITGLGILVLVFLIINGLLEGFMDKLQRMFPKMAIHMIYSVNLFLTLISLHYCLPSSIRSCPIFIFNGSTLLQVHCLRPYCL